MWASRGWASMQATQARLAKSLDLVVNSAGLTDFNPDLRDALASNVDSTLHLLDFLRKCDHAGLMHLSTCYVVGMRDGRVTEELQDNYNPARDPAFNAEKEIASLRETIRHVEERVGEPGTYESAAAAGAWAGRRSVGGACDGTRWRIETEPAALGAEPIGAHRPAPRAAFGLAEYVHVYEEPGRVHACAQQRRVADCDCAAFDCGKFGALAVYRMERGDQHFRAAVVFAGNKFQAIAFERAQVPRRDSRGHGLPRHDADRGGGDFAEACADVSAGHFGDQSGKHGAQHRAHRPGAPKTLPDAAGNRALAQSEIRNDPCFEAAVRAAVHSDAEGGHLADQSRRGFAAHEESSARAGRSAI